MYLLNKSMNKKTLFISAAMVPAFFALAGTAHANPVNFGSCLNPQWGASQVNYSSTASHGVIGVGTFAGTDTIYGSGANVLQCLCTPEGKGYQTDWMSAEGFSESLINTYKKEGWMFVATGSLYGLKDVPYLAKNSEYACQAPSCSPTPTQEVSGTPTPTSATPTPTAVPGPTATPESKVGGAVATAVNSLANTGNLGLIYSLFLTGAIALVLGLILKRFSK
jgi:hypothetical protein